ncbi:MAG TPA: ABC transporter ATP-binding protein [Alphaproteobacteria bacterium]|nr:ABC transporter ATP-binding protein [Alphaproteobacteria bacterium]
MSAPLLQVLGVQKRFGGLVALDDVGLALEAGELHALIGPNGAGKTTLIQILAGAETANAGVIRFSGHDVTQWPMHRRARLGLARSYQITNLFADFTALDNLALAVQARRGGGHGCWRPVVRQSAVFEDARATLAQIGLAERADAPARTLAHGEQRQLELGLALASGARLLLLDEPMAGMGREESARMLGLIAMLKRTTTILLVEHDMDAVFQLADRITTLVYGRVVASGAPEEIRRNPEVRRAYLGEETAA